MTLERFFSEHPEAAIAFSGGTDSAYLLWAAKRYARRVTAYCAVSAFQPAFEQADARKLAAGLGAALKQVPLDVLALDAVRDNPPDRCYHCKTAVFTALWAAARADGYAVLLDGTNASDEAGDRPGMKALEELGVLSPLRLCGLTKDEIRRRSAAAGLFTAAKPAYACLATRIPAGEPITAEKLRITEAAEAFLFSLGFSDFRVRYRNGTALLQLPAAQWPKLMEHRAEILERLKQDYRAVALDLEVRG